MAVSAADAAAPLKKPKPKPVAPVKLAGQLAHRVDSAKTDAARYNAILRVMGAIKLSVYDGKTGKALVKGLDTNRYDAYLLVGEVRGVAAALGRGQSFSTADLASLLTTVLGRTADPVPTQAANELVSGLVQVALANPKKAASVVPLLVRDLGLASDHPVDLAHAGGAEPIPLDAAQLQLIETYLLYPIVHIGSQRHVAQLRRPAARGTAVCKVLKYVLAHFNPNSYLDPANAIHVVSDTLAGTVGGKVAGEIAEKLKVVAAGTAQEALDAVFTVLAGIHGSILAWGLKLESGPPLNQGTAYGRSGLPGQGNPMVFRVHAVFHDALSPQDTECLSDMGFEMPEKPSVAGMDIAWHDEDVSGKPLYEHGSLEFDLPGLSANGRTNEDGISTVNFTPKDESAPGIGRVVTDSGGELPRALWGFKFKNPLGAVTQVFFPMLGQEIRWTVVYHKPRGFRFATPLAFPPTPSGGLNITEAITAHVCGEDLYAAPWEGTEYLLESGAGGHKEFDYPFEDWYLTRGAPSSPTISGFLRSEVKVQLLEGPPVTAHVQIHGDYPADPAHENQTFDVPVEENLSCPENG
jgi:hypothetical protein